MPPDHRIAYSVTATLPDQASADRYVAWLGSGHVAAVIAAGARSGLIVRLDPEPRDPRRRVRTWYLFASRAALEAYLRDHAPRLRAEGLAQFGPETGVAFAREIGAVVGGHEAAPS
ncbi:MAG TPA: DUF4286 family protein [Phycisphaerales bacterium]|nr:DUF4286 family protein [Phycisphaerales bacterium]